MEIAKPQVQRPEPLKAQSKTFLIGDYAVLEGSKALVIASQPQFVLQVSQRREAGFELQGIDLHGPAGKLIQEYSKEFSGLRLSFADPHQGLGGFGASSAQYLLVERFLSEKLQSKLSNKDRLVNYRNYAKGLDAKQLPSGADYLSQAFEGLVLVDPGVASAKVINWPFTDWCVRAIRTNFKVATHVHLNEKITIPTGLLTPLVDQAINAIKNSDIHEFLASINEYSKVLQLAHLVHDGSRQLLQNIDRELRLKGVSNFAIKGCGALGADVLILVHEKIHFPIVNELEVLASHRHLEIL